MKLLFLSNMKNYSGGELVMERLVLQLLQKKKYECIIVTPEGAFAERCRKNNIPVYIENGITKLQRDGKKLGYMAFFKNTIRAVRSISAYAKRESVDLIVANSFGVAFYAALLKLFTGKKTIWIHHHPIFTPDDRDKNKARIIARFTDKIICVSNALKNSLILCSVPASKIDVIYNGLDLNVFKNTPTGILTSQNNNKIRISLIGAITEWKGHRYLLEAVKLLDDEVKGAIEVAFVGGFLTESAKDMAYKTSLDQFIEKNNLKQIVSFAGSVENMVKFYKEQTDIVVNCSIQPEPLGTTIYEAMSFEKLVIVTNVGGNTEIVDDKKNGFVVNVADPSDMTKILTQVIKDWDSPELIRIRKNARLKVEQAFDLVKTANEYDTKFELVYNA